MKLGSVSLVGAGPGDPELLTMRAVARLRAADVVLYDALVDRAALRHAPQARWAFVGKRAGRPSISQRTIEKVMIRRALRGERVVRLKSGDPFVFGRGGEEALALAAAGVPCEVVPGVSSAVAGPALCGIPVTHRGVASAFLVVSGHAPSGFAAALGSLAPGAATIVVLMGLATRADTAGLLLSRGWDPETPSAVLL
ncbi:MAG: uroporphyrinogen-III C-methyltransferase, partial [Myxococcales bacterium]